MINKLKIIVVIICSIILNVGYGQAIEEDVEELFEKSNNNELPLAQKIKLAEQAIKISKNDTSLLIEAYANLGSINLIHGLYKGAFKHFNTAIKMAAKTGNKAAEANNYFLSGNAYLHLDNSKEALIAYQNASEIAQEIKDSLLIAKIYISKGIIYAQNKEFKKSSIFFNKSYQLFEKIAFKYGVSYALLNLGNNYLEMKKPDTALIYFEKTLLLDQEYENEKGVALVYINIGLVHKQKKNYELALSYFDKSLAIAKKNEFNRTIYDNYKDISDTYLLLKDYKKALVFYEKYTILKDSIVDSETEIVIAELQTTYDFEKKEKQILIANTQIKHLKITEELRV